MYNHFFQTPVIYFQEYLKFLMKWKCKLTSLIMKFSQNKFKNKSKRKTNFISKPHKRIDLIDYSKCEYLPDKKSTPIIMKTFLKEKWSNLEPPFKENPLFSTNPLSLSNFFITPLLLRISKTRTLPLILGGGKLRSIKFPGGGWITIFPFWFWKADVERWPSG